MTPGDTQDTRNLRGMIGQMGQIDPSIQYEAGRAQDRLQNRFAQPFGPDYSPEVRDSIMYNQSQEIDQRTGVAVRDSRRRGQLAQVGAQASLASLTAPRIVNTGGTGETTASGPGPAAAIIGGIASGAGGAIA